MTDNCLAGDGPLILAMSTKRRDVWPSREAAAEHSHRFLKAWDPRVVQLWKEFGYRDLPTAIYPTNPLTDGRVPSTTTAGVTLTTTKHQETTLYCRPNIQRHIQLGEPPNRAYADTLSKASETGPPPPPPSPPPHDPLLVPDMLGALHPAQRCYRPEPMLAYRLAPHIRPSVLYVSASHSALGKAGEHADAAKRTGTGFGGSGGMAYGRVRYVMIQKAGHTLPLEKVADTARALGPWLGQELGRWWQDEARVAEGWRGRPVSEKSGFPEAWDEVIKSLPLLKRQAKI